MGFLLAKMVLLLAAAVLAGAALAYWWFRRHYEDVTLDYARTRDEFAAWRERFEERLAARPEVDLRPVSEQIADVHLAVRDLPSPEPVDLAPVDARLTAIEHALFPLQSRLDELTAAVRALRPPSEPGRVATAEPEGEPAAGAPAAAATPVARNLLTHPSHGEPDDLTRIRGLPKVLEQTLHKVGVFYFWQIAEWSPEDVAYVDSQLERFQGRIESDGWIDQASELAQQVSATTADPH
ncbi:MAG: hypothetical protein JOZ67_10475 [Gammaproteobacteria bacterium]|nr:hypothetical protein [Gammaproteobacteria bacterium]